MEPAILIADVTATAILCNGDNSNITVSANGGSSPYTGTGTFVEPAGTYNYTVTDTHGCTTNTTITVSQPSAIAISQTVSLCSGQSITIGTNTYTSTGIYVDVLISVNGCDSTVTSDVNINSPIDVTTSLNGLTITANQPGATYQWIDCDNNNANISGETNQNFTASNNGNYAVIVTQNSCSDTSACVNISTVGLKQLSNNNNLNIFPNPTNGIITISGLNEKSTIVIYDAIGQEVIKSVNTDATISINLEKEKSGIYMIKISSNNNDVIKKVIKY
jgi:hypothetical protein